MQRISVVFTALTALGLAACSNPFDARDAEDPGSDLQDTDAMEAEVPAFGDIRDDMFSAMLAAESVTIDGEVEAGEADLDELFDGLDDDTTGSLSISGALDGSESEMSFSAGGSSFTQRAVDGQEYFRGEDFAALLVSELDDEVADLVEEDFVEETISDSWVLFEDSAGSVFSAEEFITTWQNELTGEDVDAMAAHAEERDGETVWVYTADGGESEFVVTAEDGPYLLEITDEDSHYEFTEWNASGPPEAPENVITLDEIFEAIAEQQGWDPDALENEESDDGGAEEPDA
ncbi:hypothetical protein [Nesterenkonia haasae]|uniref:hypothetical protein n=1 Tax=Nesterenkonia haasae TaxID=2587813 RepID=UPI001390F51B|nr:hypothetical protein [Nesterenkonia haasae]NDK31092.1 hypothetical protein [Nesterenkonia haasae]